MTTTIGGRVLENVRFGIGVTYLFAPSLVMGPASQTAAGRRVAVVVGLRHILQSAALRVLDTRLLHRVGSWVDATHAASMVFWWLGSTRSESMAARQAAEAGIFAALESIVSHIRSSSR